MIDAPTRSELMELLRYLTPQEKDALDRLLWPTIEAPEVTDFTAYKRHIYKRYLHAPHLAELDRYLMEVSRYVETGGREGIGFLIVEMPPRHGKTVTISRLFPTWFIGRNPDKRVILASYGATLAKKNSRYTRNVLMSRAYQGIFPGVRLAPDSASAEAWDIAEHEGGQDAMGVGGGVTGKGGHVIIIDDPVKSREEAESETYRQNVYDWYTDDIYTRREPGGAIIIVMTRWHMDDLVGRVLRDDPQKWVRLRLPAIAEHGDLIGRSEGAALWPDRYPLATLRDIEKTLGPYSWSALYQQNPVPSEGGTFKREWFRTSPYIPELTQVVRYWDLAMSEKTSADYTVGVKMGMGVDGHLYVLDVQRVQKEWGDVTPFLVDIAHQDGPNVMIGLEEAGYMSRAVQDLIDNNTLHHHAIWGYPKHKDKFTNALPFAARCAAGNVVVLERHWTRDYIDELCSFDKGAHDDQVDASAGAYTMLGSPYIAGDLNYADDYSIGEGTY